ncbi:MAG: nitroreductase family protein [Lachnospiraceae bacterium]|nr:nitroreductase family protein [Lachnospiraceae bacterium]
MDKINDMILKRHSCRFFCEKKIEKAKVDSILEAARWAPSGKNGQPCRYVVIYQNIIKEKIASCSIYGKWMKNASVFIAVYIDKKCSYDYKKDLQSVGAAIENMCLQAEYLGIGSCWVGEILKKEKEVNSILNVPIDYELMAVVCFGYELTKSQKTDRKELETIVYKIYNE